MSDSVQPYGLKPARLLCPWDSLGKSTRVLTQGLNQSILLCRQILNHWATREAHIFLIFNFATVLNFWSLSEYLLTDGNSFQVDEWVLANWSPAAFLGHCHLLLYLWILETATLIILLCLLQSQMPNVPPNTLAFDQHQSPCETRAYRVKVKEAKLWKDRCMKSTATEANNSEFNTFWWHHIWCN